MVSKPARNQGRKAKDAVKQHFEDVSLVHATINEDEPKKIGRPQYIPTDNHYQIVRALCLFGAPHEYISQYIGITDKTLRKYYPELLATCKENKNYSVESSLFIQALRGNVDACKYWLDNHLKMTYNKNPITKDPDGDSAQKILDAIAKALPD